MDVRKPWPIAAALALLVAPAHAQAPVEGVVSGVSMDCDAIVYSGQLAPKLEAELKPIHRLDDIAAALKRHNVAFQRSRERLSFKDMPAPIYTSIIQLPQGEPFIVPNPQGGTICVPIPSADSY